MDSREQITVVGDDLLVLAPAKINLSLLIAGKRPDGFHEIETVMAKIDWYDEVLLQPAGRTGIEFICDGPQWAPPGKDNLVYQAAKSLLQSCGLTNSIRVRLTKNIPAGTGLGCPRLGEWSRWYSRRGGERGLETRTSKANLRKYHPNSVRHWMNAIRRDDSADDISCSPVQTK